MSTVKFVESPLYKKALAAVRKGFAHKLDPEYSQVTIEPRLKVAKATVKDLQALLDSDFDSVVRYSIEKMKAMDDHESEEVYPPGYDPDEDELPVTIEDHGYDKGYLILNLLEILAWKRGGKALEEYIKASRIPKAPKVAKEIAAILKKAGVPA